MLFKSELSINSCAIGSPAKQILRHNKSSGGLLEQMIPEKSNKGLNSDYLDPVGSSEQRVCITQVCVVLCAQDLAEG